jgi:DNA polymerase-3 subunit delta'
MSSPIYPWQTDSWNLLHENRARLHHAILVSGEQGVGKTSFAQHFAQSLLCLNPNEDGFACLKCQSCHWYQSFSHPDFMSLSPNDDKKDEEEVSKSSNTKKLITVDQVRALADFLSLSSHQKFKVVLIYPADGMNPAATNALLKMLEEPPENTFFILVANSSKQLLPTVRSRCQEIHIPKPDSNTAQSWLNAQSDISLDALKYAGGNPLLAKEANNYAECMALVELLSQGKGMDISVAISKCLLLGMDVSIDVLQKWLHDLLSKYHGLPLHFHSLSNEKFEKTSKAIDIGKTLDYADQLIFFKKYSQHPLNQELQFESLCLNYLQIFKA